MSSGNYAFGPFIPFASSRPMSFYDNGNKIMKKREMQRKKEWDEYIKNLSKEVHTFIEETGCSFESTQWPQWPTVSLDYLDQINTDDSNKNDTP